MGGGASLASLPELIDHDIFQRVSGDRYSRDLFDALKDDKTDTISREVLLRELNTKFDVFLTHDWSNDELSRNNHDRVSKVNKWLKENGIICWFDEERMKGNIVQQMCNGIDNASIVIVFITKNYITKIVGRGPKEQGDNCLIEYNYCLNRKTTSKMLAVVHESCCFNTQLWVGPVGLLGPTLYIDNTSDDKFEKNMQILLSQIEGMITP